MLSRRAALLFALLASLGILLFASSWTRTGVTLPSQHVSASGVATRNPWHALDGLLLTAEAQGIDAKPSDPASLVHVETIPVHDSLAAAIRDVPLAAALQPALARALSTPTGHVEVRERRVPAGPTLSLTFDTGLQAAATAWVRCFTGEDLAACASLPPSLKSDPRFDASRAPRAPVAALLVAERDTGRVVAFAGAVAACVRRQLQRHAQADAAGNRPIFESPAARCAQLPDERHAWLATQHPGMWQVPPGSAAKLLGVVACIAEGKVAPSEMPILRRKIAASADNAYFQRLVLRCPGTYARLWKSYAAPFSPMEALHAKPQPAALPPTIDTAYVLGADTFEAIRVHRRSGGTGAERELGAKMMFRYLQTQALVSVAIGDGGHTASLPGLSRLMRDLGLRAEGLSAAPPLHMAVSDAVHLEDAPLIDVSPQAARQLLDLLRSVTAASHGGTATGACARVLGTCAAGGLAGFGGKTGTSDFTLGDAGNTVKPGQSMPVKVFTGFFESQGTHYIVGAMVFRGRAADGSLELAGNAAAELALLARLELDRAASLGWGANPSSAN